MIRGRGLLSFTRKGRQPLAFSLAAFESHSVFDPRAQGQESGTERNRKNGEIKDALKTLGAETRLVVYEHEGHHFVNPEQQRARIRRTVAWFSSHLR